MRVDRIKFVTELTKQDMSLTKLSSIIGVSRVTLSNIKLGKSCSEETACKIADGLNIPLEKLIEN